MNGLSSASQGSVNFVDTASGWQVKRKADIYLKPGGRLFDSPGCGSVPSRPRAVGSVPSFPLGTEAAGNASPGAVPVGIEPDGGALSAALTARGINPALRDVVGAGVATAAAGVRATPPARAAAGEAPGAETAPPPELELCSAADCCGRPAVPEAPASIAPPAAPVRLASRSDDCSPLAR